MVVSKRLLVESNLQGEVTGLPGKLQREFIHIVLDVKKKEKKKVEVDSNCLRGICVALSFKHREFCSCS